MKIPNPFEAVERSRDELVGRKFENTIKGDIHYEIVYFRKLAKHLILSIFEK